jgi:hypothetical protein
MATAGQAGRAMFSFLTEIIGPSSGPVADLRDALRAYDLLAIVTATLPREARAIMSVDLLKDARAVTCPGVAARGEQPAMGGRHHI